MVYYHDYGHSGSLALRSCKHGYHVYTFSISIECTNRFVEVQYNSATSTISCVFLSELDTSEKSCSILYGVCDQEQTKMAVGNTTSSSVMLKVDVTGSYCYTLVARNGTYTIMVDGRIGKVILVCIAIEYNYR